MKFAFIANACGVFVGNNGTRLLCDPWIMDGVFEGSWCHFPPLKTKLSDIQDVDGIYVSHIHPDHFDERTFDFNRDIPVFILDRGHNFLTGRLNQLGYRQIRCIRSGERTNFREFQLAIYEPFAKHNFHYAAVGNVIDSALVIASGGNVALNANDNTPTPEACKMLKESWGAFDLAMLNYNAAGPYPSCFENLSVEEKMTEHLRILERNMSFMVTLLETLEPRACLPFAGAYVLGGSLHTKNPYLGTTTWDECAQFLRARLLNCEVVTMRESDVLDLCEMRTHRPYVPIDLIEQERYVRDVLAHLKYPYELDPTPDPIRLLIDLEKASGRMLERARRLGLSTTFSVRIHAGDVSAQVIPKFDTELPTAKRNLDCGIDPRLLRRILDRRAQWNSSEIGCHINFKREPNEYEPDLHTMLQFLHL